jgi:hypothetical protein
MVPRALALPDHDLASREIDILHPQAHTLHDPHAGPVEETDHQSYGAAEMCQDRFDLRARQHDRQAGRPFCRLDAFEPRQRRPENFLVQEQDRTLGLVLRRGRHPLGHREVGQEPLDLRRPHVAGVSLVVMQYEAADPVYVRLLGPDAIVFAPDPVPNLVQQTGLSVTHTDLRRCLLPGVRGYYNPLKCLIRGSGSCMRTQHTAL